MEMAPKESFVEQAGNVAALEATYDFYRIGKELQSASVPRASIQEDVSRATLVGDHGELAIVLCTEVLPSARLAATKVFVRRPEGWRLIHHQASEIAARPRIARVPVVRAS